MRMIIIYINKKEQLILEIIMALAYGNFHELSHQLRFLLFEIGIGLPQNSIENFITLAHKNALNRLQHAALAEKLINAPIASHHVHDFIDQLEMKLKQSKPASQFFQWQTLRDELDDSIANDALAHAYKQRWNTQVSNEASQYGSLWAWINNEMSAHQALLFLEQWGCQGHTYHPSFSAKPGFTRREVLQNSPEFQAKISLHWCALNKSQAIHPPQSIDFNKLMAQAFPREFKLWQEKLIFNRINPQEYYPVPIHPWQWRNKLQMMCTQMTDNKSLILFPHHQTVMPSMSNGIMMPVHYSETQIKLAVASRTSYTNRGKTQDACVISQWINTLLTQENNYERTLFLAQDLTELQVVNKAIPHHHQKEFSVSLLPHPASLVESSHKVVPSTSLFSISPLSKKPLLIEIINESTINPMDFFSRYCDKVLFSQLHLLLKYGVAFESQPHNTLIIFADNIPQGLIMRETEEVKIAYSVFHEDNNKPHLSPASKIKTTSLDTLRATFINGTLQNSLGCWINIINREYQIDRHQLWKIVNQSLHTTLNNLAKDIHPRIFSWQKYLLLNDIWQHQCLLTMGLMGNNKDIYIPHPNPLNGHTSPG